MTPGMTPEQMVREGLKGWFFTELIREDVLDDIVDRMAAVIRAEREACAQLARRMYPPSTVGSVNTMSIAAETIAAAIRART